MKDWVLIEKDLFIMWNSFSISYASQTAEEPLCELSMIEVEKILSSVVFSKNSIYNNCIKLILRLHCLGVPDTNISKGLKMLGQELEVNTITQIRHKSLKKINDKYGENIGLITLLYETFREVLD